MHRNETDSAAPRRVFTVAELNKEIQAALQVAFPATVWVRGEVQRLPQNPASRKHLYFELHDTSGGGAANFQIPVALLQWDRERFGLGKYLDGVDPDFQLRNELEVCLECRVDFYPPFGKLTLKVVGLDKNFTLGQLEALRRQVLAFLEREQLLNRNAQVPFPDLPLQVGLITAAGSAAERDFRTGLAASSYPFQVDLIDCRMQGEQTERQVVQALQVLTRRKMDVIVITRGGGSRGDLSWFDQQGIAVAIARAEIPVVTAIGHEIDRSIADVVAYQACKTPTAAAEYLVSCLDLAAERLAVVEDAVHEQVEELLTGSRNRLHTAAARLELQVGRKVARAREELGRQRTQLASKVAGHLTASRLAHTHRVRALNSVTGRRLDSAQRELGRLAPRLTPARLLGQLPRRRLRLGRYADSLGRLLPAMLASANKRLDHLGDQARLLDPERLLARGYTLTLDSTGNLLKSVRGVTRGQRLRTQFHDGQVQSVVDQTFATTPGGDKAVSGEPTPDERVAGSPDEATAVTGTPDGDQTGKGDGGGGKKTHPGQKSLFR